MKKNHLFGAVIMLCATLQNHLFSQENVLPENGNVGIGTINPTEKLQVNGSARIDSMLLVQDSMIVRKGTVMEDNLTVEGDFKLTGNAYFNQPIYYSNYPSLNLADSGLKLIGTDASGMLKSMTFQEMIQGSFSTCIPESNGSYLPYWSSGPNKVYVNCPSTFVGINTSIPTHSLHIVGDQFTTGNGQFNRIGINSDPSTFSNLKVQTHNTSGAAIEIVTNTTGEYTKGLFIHANSPKAEVMKVIKDTDDPSIVRFVLSADGYMQVHNGIKKTLQLDTDGLLHSRRIKVDILNWADYVFESNHKLPTIDEVEAYIAENKHLPGIPDAETMQNQGLDIAETNVLMMEQIEEQMLYIIELKKELEALKMEVNDLKRGE